MTNDVRNILREARARLQTAQFGLADLRGPPPRRRSGFHNAVVFGRMVTFVLQNLRGKAPGFDPWYEGQQKTMKADPVCRYFVEARNAIEKQGQSKLVNYTFINYMNSEQLKKLAEPRPPGGTAIFVGDQDGASGWIIKRDDGSEEKYYFEIPESVAVSGLALHQPPNELQIEDSIVRADAAVEKYLSVLESLVREAENRFGRQDTK